MGGSDQWGNIVTGTELIRRKSAGEAFAFTSPLITKADGSKFGKSETGNIWLDPIKTSPYQFYQFWLNASDADAQNWIKIFTFLDRETIETLVRQHAENPSERILQKKLAETLTLFVHGEAEFKKAWETTAKLFSNPNAAIENLSEEDLKAIEGIERKEYDKQLLEKGIEVTQLMADTTIFSSKGEARKMIQNGGLSINRKKVNNATDTINSSWLLHNRYLLVQKGKRNYYLIEITG